MSCWRATHRSRATARCQAKHATVRNELPLILADYLTGAAGQALATGSVSLDESLNRLIDGGYQAFDVRTADVQDAFSTADFSDTAPVPGAGTAPLNVARICGWTWMCAPWPVGPNIHANATGYQQIAAAFEQAIGCLGRRGR